MVVPTNPTADLVHEMEAGSLYLEVLGPDALGEAGPLGQGPIGRPQGQSFTRVTLNGAGYQPPNPTTYTGSCDVLLIGQPGSNLVTFHCASDIPAGITELRFRNPRSFAASLDEPSFRLGDLEISEFLNGEYYVAFDESVRGDGIVGRIGPCWSGTQADGDQGLCLTNDRFKVDVAWKNSAGATGSGTGSFAGQNGDTCLFRFATPDNWELLVKVLDACALEGVNSFGVFAAGLTNVEVDIIVTDTQTNQVKTYMNPLGTPFQPIQDTTAFATCP